MNEKIKQQILGRAHYRTVQNRAENVDTKTRTIPMSFSSETPVVRWWGIEVLDHSQGSVRMDRAKQGIAFLDSHDPTKQGGRIENLRCTDQRRCEGPVRFANTAIGDELFSLHSENIRQETSMGYLVHDAVEMKPEEMSDELKTLALNEALPVYRINDWEPLEGSSVSIPADPTVGQRSLQYYDDLQAYAMVIQGRSSELGKLIPEIVKEARENQQIKQPTKQGVTVMTEEERKAAEAKEAAEAKRSQEERARLEQERVRLIKETGDKFKARIRGGEKAMDVLVKGAIDLNQSIEAFRGSVFLQVNDTSALDTPASFLDLTPKEVRSYSLRKAILSQFERKSENTFEMECSKEVEKRLGQAAKGMYVPYDMQTVEREVPLSHVREMERLAKRYKMEFSKRDLVVGTATAGGNLVATVLMASSFIELLRNRLIGAKAGMITMPGLVGNIAFPKQTGASTFFWVAENSGLTQSAPTLGQVTLSPKSGGGYVNFSRQLLLQSTPAVDMLVLNDLVKVVALGVDKSGFHGLGSGNNQPTGIENTSLVATEDGTDYGFATAVSHETDVMKANADVETMAYVTNPGVYGLLKTRPKASSGYPIFIIEDGEMNGYPVLVSNQINPNYIFFGDFSQAIMGEWGVLDILVDPYTGGTAGTIKTIAFISVDVAVRQVGAFSFSNNVS